MSNKPNDETARAIAGAILTAAIVSVWLYFASYAWHLGQQDRALVREVLTRQLER